jgi:hypothetical protein
MKPFVSVQNNAPGSGKLRELKGFFGMSVNGSHCVLVVNEVTLRSQGFKSQPSRPLGFLMRQEPSEQHAFPQEVHPVSQQSSQIVVEYSGNKQQDDDFLHHKVPAPYHKEKK